MFPVPIVADSEVIKAWNGEISPSLVRSTGWSSILMP